jgi:hypothetical protein
MGANAAGVSSRYAAVVLAIGWLSLRVAAQPLREFPGEADSVSFLSGGVGQREQAALLEEAELHDLMVTFARRSDGAYLGNVDVTIRDATGEAVIDARTEGPILLADMPPGTYTISAQVPGWEVQQRSVEIGEGGLQRVQFGLMPAAGETMQPSER